MYKLISKEEATTIANEYNRTHTDKLKYITQNKSGQWEGWSYIPISQPTYWANREEYGILLSPEINIENWKSSLIQLD